MLALLQEVFEEQTDFELRPERLRAALGRLERAALAGAAADDARGDAARPHDQLQRGGADERPDDLPSPTSSRDCPRARSPPRRTRAREHLIVALTAGEDDPREAIARGREILKDLLRALRLFGDGRVTLGALAWARVGGRQMEAGRARRGRSPAWDAGRDGRAGG